LITPATASPRPEIIGAPEDQEFVPGSKIALLFVGELASQFAQPPRRWILLLRVTVTAEHRLAIESGALVDQVSVAGS
jgi:hypothetical protein